MMVLWIVPGYIALAAMFYMALAATATDISVPAAVRQPKRHRAHRVADGRLFRRSRRF